MVAEEGFDNHNFATRQSRDGGLPTAFAPSGNRPFCLQKMLFGVAIACDLQRHPHRQKQKAPNGAFYFWLRRWDLTTTTSQHGKAVTAGSRPPLLRPAIALSACKKCYLAWRLHVIYSDTPTGKSKRHQTVPFTFGCVFTTLIELVIEF